MNWQLRRATVEDLEAIMKIENSVFATDAWSLAAMREELASSHNFYLVASGAETTEKICGYGGLRASKGSGEGEIQTIAVSPAARRQGLGGTIMLAMISEARKRAAREVFLEVRADNPGAQALYRSLGFEQIATRPHYYQPDGVDALVMRLRVSKQRPSTAVGS